MGGWARIQPPFILSEDDTPLSPLFAPGQRRLKVPSAKRKFLAVDRLSFLQNFLLFRRDARAL